ncbi:MAG: hypothetical protein IPH78_09920 [Bacteroidetes bacterium]|nr:hypothetical protein [Bacteroidota bacterium]
MGEESIVGETNEMLKQKIKLALQEGLTPVFLLR